LIAGLIIGIIASLISISQGFVATKIAKHAGKWPGDIQNIINDVQDNVIKDLEDNNVSIKISTDKDTIDINAKVNVNKKNREQKLEDLEGVKTEKNDTLQKEK
jgi:hypothetical protein